MIPWWSVVLLFGIQGVIYLAIFWQVDDFLKECRKTPWKHHSTKWPFITLRWKPIEFVYDDRRERLLEQIARYVANDTTPWDEDDICVYCKNSGHDQGYTDIYEGHKKGCIWLLAHNHFGVEG